MEVWLQIIFIVVLWCSVLAGNVNTFSNRSKRFLSFPVNGGTIKLVMGLGIPVDLPTGRSLGFSVNLQAQYTIPPRIIRWYDKWKYTRSINRQKRLYPDHNECIEDDSRQFLYKIIEVTMARQGKIGKECLLRAICENAQHPLKDNGLIGEIIDSILTPGKGNIANTYHDAKLAGLSGADCLLLFQKCPHGLGLLDYISFLD